MSQKIPSFKEIDFKQAHDSISAHMKRLNIDIDQALLNKLVEVALSGDIWTERMMPQVDYSPADHIDGNSTLTIQDGFQIGYQPYHKVKELRARIEKLETTLRYYADSYNYGDGNGLSWESTDIRNDRGKRAREALGWAVIL